MPDNEENVCSTNNCPIIQRYLLSAFFLAAALSPHLPISLSAQGWEAIQTEKFDGSGFSATLDGVPGFHAVGFVRGGYGATGGPGDICALLQPYAAGSLIAMEAALEPGFEYRLKLNVKSFGQGQAVRFSRHTAPSSGGAAIGSDIPTPSISADDPGMPGVEVASTAFTVDAGGNYWVIAQAQRDSPGGWARYDDMVLERRVDGCPSVAGPDREICQGDVVQIGTGCLPDPHPKAGVSYCYAWVPMEGLTKEDGMPIGGEESMPFASPDETTLYTVYVTTSEGELVAEDEVEINVESFEVNISATNQVLCQGESALLEATNTFETYQWVKNGEIIGNNSTLQIYTGGVYTLTVTNVNNCMASVSIQIGEAGDPSSLKDVFISKGFMSIPINIVGELGLQNSSNRSKVQNSLVDDCAELAIQILGEGGEAGFDIGEILNLFLNQEALSVATDLKSGFITKNDVFCSPGIPNCIYDNFSQVETNFEAADFGVWVHLWENPQQDENDCLLVQVKSPRIVDGYGPVNQSHQAYVINTLELLLTDNISLVPFDTKGERLSYAVFDLLWQGFPIYLLNENDLTCDIQFKFKGLAPSGPNIIGITEFIGLMEDIENEIEINYPEEVRNTKLMITRFRRIFYNTDGWNTTIIPGAFSPESQSPFGQPCIQERERIPVDGTWFNFDYVDYEVYPCVLGTDEPPAIYINQQVKLEAGSSNGFYIDIGHIFAGLDAYNHPTSIAKTAPIFGTLGVERSVDAATWVGDVGSSIAFAKIDYINGGKELLSPCELQSHIDKGTPPQDMLGNIDAYSIAKNYPVHLSNNGPKVSEIFKNYFLGMTSVSLPENGLQLYQNYRFSTFANCIGLTINNGEFTNREFVIQNYQDQLADIAGIIIAISGEGFLDLPLSFPFGYGITRDQESARIMMELLLDELLNCVNSEP